MLFRKDKYGTDLSILGFGCMRFPQMLGRIDIKKSTELIAYAIAHNINYFDTAWLYPGNEEALGTALASLGKRKDIYIATKMPSMVCKKREDLDKYFNESLHRLKTDYIDYYLMHNLPDFTLWEYMKNLGVLEWIARKKNEGAVKQIGFSFHGNRDDFIRILNDYDWEFCQIQYNYSDENFQAGKAGLEAAAAKGIPVIIMEPLLGGKLARDLPGPVMELFNADNPRLAPAARGLLWLWNQREVTVVLSGMNTFSQLTENLEAAEQGAAGCVQDGALYEKARDEFKKTYKIQCTGCNYCQPCPKGINIPGCFSAYNTSYAIDFITGMKHYVMSTGAHSPTPHIASLCIKCGKCEHHCPQHIPIRSELVNVIRRMEPFYFKLIMLIIKVFWQKKPRTAN